MKLLLRILALIIFNLQVFFIYGQQIEPMLFDRTTPLDITLKVSIRQVANTKRDSIYLPHILYFGNKNGQMDSVKAGLKSRGNFRLKECYFPPLWIKFNKKDIKGTVFEGNKKLKLVLPCYKQKGSNALVVREYLCYKLFELVSPYFFKTQLVNIDFINLKNKKEENYPLIGILIEDLDVTAKRLHARALKNTKLHPVVLQDTADLRFAFFQFMISNVDLSSAYQHNTKLIQLSRGDYLSLPYDFDFSGLVNAPYSFVSEVGGESLGMAHVRDRLYRGYCRPAGVTEIVRKEFLAKKDAILSCADAYKNDLTEDDISDIKNYLEDFFNILSKDALFKESISIQCRPAN